MAAKGNKNNDSNNNSNGGKYNNNTGDGDEGGYDLDIVLKVDLHCDSCCRKIRKALLSFPGVHVVSFKGETTVKIVAGRNVDAVKVAENLQKKILKEVELVSPKPPKKDDQKKPKEMPLTTVIRKIQYHCERWVKKTYKAVPSCKGVNEVMIDKEKDELVTVKGKQMVESIKKPVESVPEKKNQKDKKKQEENKGGEKVMMGDYYSKESMMRYHEYGYGSRYGCELFVWQRATWWGGSSSSTTGVIDDLDMVELS